MKHRKGYSLNNNYEKELITMRVHVENDLYISADGREYTLERKRVAESGKQAGKIF
jgi:hypothetical protein